MFTAEVAVVGGENDDRVIDLLVFAERLEDTADIVVETFHHPVILRHKQPHGVGGDTGIGGGPAGSLRARFVDRHRDRHLHVFVQLIVWLADGIRAVWIGKTDHVTERLPLFLLMKFMVRFASQSVANVCSSAPFSL